jgi:hypothetical protein
MCGFVFYSLQLPFVPIPLREAAHSVTAEVQLFIKMVKYFRRQKGIRRQMCASIDQCMTFELEG